MSKRAISDRQEERVSKTLGIRRVGGSGSGSFQKADVKGKNILIECKAKEKESLSHSIKHEWLKKLKREALGMGKHYYALAFDFGGDEDFYIIDERQMKEFMRCIEDDNV